MASTTEASTWSTFLEALTALRDGPYAGIGFVLTDDDDLFCIDLDHCIDPTTRQFAPWAQAIVDRMQTYTEFSPTDGLHLWGRGALPPGTRRKGQIEMYEVGRYLTVTGRQLGPHATVNTREEEVWALHADVFPVLASHADGPPTPQPVNVSDERRSSTKWCTR